MTSAAKELSVNNWTTLATTCAVYDPALTGSVAKRLSV